MTAPLYGNPQKGMNAGITKIPAGEKHPLHTHSANIRLVVISGTWLQGADEASAKEYTAGAYIYVPGGFKHFSGCKDGAECVFFQENSGPFDMKPVEAAAAPAAK
jgi:quercetin dioxygenase-like cupin family protein